jgi:hypothetical protein
VIIKVHNKDVPGTIEVSVDLEMTIKKMESLCSIQFPMNPPALTKTLGRIMLSYFMDHSPKLLGFVFQPFSECKITLIQHVSCGFCIDLSIHFLGHFRNTESRNQYIHVF